VLIDKTKQTIKIRNKIIKFVNSRLKNNIYTSKRDIEKNFGINISTYFNSIIEIYKNSDIDISTLARARMGGNIDKEVMRNRILDFFREEVKKGHYPTYKEIQRTFDCLPKLFFPGGIREIYNLLELEYDRSFAVKTVEEKEKIKKEIIKFVRKSQKQNSKPTYRDIKNKFKIGIDNYFENGIREIYKEAGIELEARKGLRN